MTFRFTAALCLSLVFAISAGTAARAAERELDPPNANWRTISLTHFRVHYPSEYEEWATYVASRLESIRSVVSAEVGFEPPQVIDVLVVNPAASANGTAYPFLAGPRMVLYLEPFPGSEHLGPVAPWPELVTTHEMTHLVHLLRPSRSPLGKAVEQLLISLSPITISAPRWITEGYATVIEGRITGGGRPTSTMRALILRQWAANGRLPTYEQLDEDPENFLGMRMAYFVGSAFLEWLEQRHGKESLHKLWTHISSRKWPSFDEAFADVYGERPEKMYGRFVAEVTASAMSLERSSRFAEGNIFEETPRDSGDPAASPDGKMLAVVVRDRDEPERLVVWSTEPDAEETEKREKRIERELKRDPEDIRPFAPKHEPHQKLHTLAMEKGGGDIENPRWTKDGKALLFAHRAGNREGLLRYDLYLWDLDEVRRVTTNADVRDADPSPDGQTAVAVRSRFGKSQLVNVDLRSGAVTERTPASIDLVRSHPRFSPDGKHLAWIEHRNARLQLIVDGAVVQTPGDPASPEWLSNDELVTTIFTPGFAELYRVRLDGTATRITTSRGGAFDPTVASEQLYFMSLQPDGYEVRVTSLSSEASASATAPPLDLALVPAVPATATAPQLFSTQPVSSRPYGFGRLEHSSFFGMNLTQGHRALELGARFGDVVGRSSTLVIGSLAKDDAPAGIAIASAWRGWPVELQGHAFHLTGGRCFAASDSTTENGERDSTCFGSSNGLELRALWNRHFNAGDVTLEAGALSDDLLFGAATINSSQGGRNARLRESLRIDVDDEHHRGRASIAFSSGGLNIGGSYQRDRGSALALGGLSSSLLPQSAYAHRLLDPALPAALLRGEEYDGWRVESSLSALKFFYQRHELDAASLSLAGVELSLHTDTITMVKTPGLDLTLGGARILDGSLEGDTRYWLGMRWRP
jgi:hypothetical protein